MRIAYLSLLAPPDNPAVSGVPKVSETLLREFESLPDLVVEAITLVDGLERAEIRQHGSVRYHYLPVRAKGKTATFYIFEQRRLRRMVRELNVELVHGQPTGEYLLAATDCGLPHVITIHGLVMREAAGLSAIHPGRFANWLRERIQQRAVRRAQNIISISSYVEEYLNDRPHGKVWPIANPIDPEFFDIAAPDRQGLRVLCVGIVSERKNQALLVQACALLRKKETRFECHIVGQFAPGAEERMQRLIQELGVGDSVSLKGKVSRADLSKEYAWSNVVVLPSREETSPLSLIQAMACGRCVLGADAAGIPKLLGQGACGTLFAPESPQALAGHLGALSSNAVAYWGKAEAGRDYASSTFRPDVVARRTVEVYHRILGRKPRR